MGFPIARCFGLSVCAALALVCTAVLQSSPHRADAAIVNCSIDAGLDGEEKAFLTLINNYRAQNGKLPLAVSYKLSKAAQWKSNDMGVNSYFAHDDLSRSWVQRIRDCGYGYNTYIGENIAAGISSAQSAFDLWKNSAGHNANMLGSNYNAIGIGRAFVAGSPYGWYWTTEFGGADDGWANATAPVTRGAGTEAPPLRLIVRERSDGSLRLRAIAGGGAVDRVAFYVDGALVAIDRRAPFTVTWHGETDGPVVYVIARFHDGRVARSDADSAALMPTVHTTP